MKYCFDIDGTICNNTHGKYKEAKPFLDVIKKVNTLYDAGNKIIFFTARGTTTGIDWSGLTKSQLVASVAEEGLDGSVHTMVVDLDDRLAFDRFLVDLENYPDVDILVANSGGPAPGDFNSFSSVVEFEQKCSEITYAASSLIKYVLPNMREKSWVE